MVVYTKCNKSPLINMVVAGKCFDLMGWGDCVCQQLEELSQPEALPSQTDDNLIKKCQLC